MNLHAEISNLSLDPAVIERLLMAVNGLHITINQTTSQLKLAELKVQALTLELAHHKRLKFGVKSEALAPAQRELFAEDWGADNAELELAVDALQTAPRAPRKNAGRQPLPESLPRIIHRHEPSSCACGQCGASLTLLREDVSEQLDVEPARFFVHRHIRPQYACRACEIVVAEPTAAAIIDGGLAAPGLLMWLLINKFQDHIPLYRLEQIAARSGVNLARSTLADWAGRCGVALQPLADRLAELLRQRPVLHADETPVQQLDPGKGKTKRAYLWAYRSNDLDDGPPIAVFDYQAGRAGEHARAFLGEWRGHLVVDDYPGYKALFTRGVSEIGCSATAPALPYLLHPCSRGRMRAVNFLICIKPIKTRRHWPR